MAAEHSQGRFANVLHEPPLGPQLASLMTPEPQNPSPGTLFLRWIAPRSGPRRFLRFLFSVQAPVCSRLGMLICDICELVGLVAHAVGVERFISEL